MIFYQILLSSLITFTWIYYYVAGYRMVIFYFYCSFHIYQLAFSWKEETFHPYTLLFTFFHTYFLCVNIYYWHYLFWWSNCHILKHWSLFQLGPESFIHDPINPIKLSLVFLTKPGVPGSPCASQPFPHVTFREKWYLETKIWSLDVFTVTRDSSLITLGQFHGQS